MIHSDLYPLLLQAQVPRLLRGTLVNIEIRES